MKADETAAPKLRQEQQHYGRKQDEITAGRCEPLWGCERLRRSPTFRTERGAGGHCCIATRAADFGLQWIRWARQGAGRYSSFGILHKRRRSEMCVES